ncbi:hypothetical protein LMB76_04075 [Limosilactobacillus reuteri]|jgi:hypothetical protein|uniref:Uncharacterized protein n=1 Tax=Limosilactobacillus reuteri TaxID=1598 RepID=A0AAW4X4G5_LIMRT|nr:hypothetical protein [Limosilactobacillus reuteri]MCC4477396.1 hypothetical protein [Limosilactobacillus reuteri]MCC4479673.1 hypothetical protein [Limosilactobacillus reuteri]MCC4489021.1 hypothetical protein [Limosilactobacillus reuteri]MCC4493280.1 hypothetical protein [Limosilactobacillus reuteri]MCC4496048.1 hypothetical protein [Limosilactobacillus reuteri]
MNYKTYYRTVKSHALKFVDPGDDYKRRYFASRDDYKSVLMRLLVSTVDRLNGLGVNIKIVVGDDNNKHTETKEAA